MNNVKSISPSTTIFENAARKQENIVCEELTQEGYEEINRLYQELVIEQDERMKIRQVAPSKIRWSSKEDQMLKFAVSKIGAKNWKYIAMLIPIRTAKQCRERWIIQFDPSFNRDEWKSEDDAILIELHHVYGNKWSKIGSIIGGRSSVNIKNRWKLISGNTKHSKFRKNTQNLPEINIQTSPRPSIDVEKVALETSFFQEFDNFYEELM